MTATRQKSLARSGADTSAADASATRPTKGVPRRFRIGHVPFDAVTFPKAIDLIADRVARGAGGSVFTPNVDHVVLADEDPRLRDAYASVSLSLVDGMALFWAARLLGMPIPEKISGSDIVIPLLRRAAAEGAGVFLLGGSDGIGQHAAARLKSDIPNLRIVGCAAPRIALGGDAESYAEITSVVRQSRAGLVLVALGCPKQELFIHAVRHQLGPAVAVGIGATLDFIAGRVRRAPRWVSDAGLEWAFRLGQEPRRLFHRYMVRDPKFIPIVLRELAAKL